VFSSILGVSIVVSRVYIFYEAWSEFSLRRTDEAWLRERCKEPDFYANMRQHTDVCAQVEKNARASVLLHALNVAFTTPGNFCGSKQSCLDYLNDLVVRGLMWPLVAVIGIFMIMVPSILSSIARRSIWNRFDHRARHIDASAPFYPSIENDDLAATAESNRWVCLPIEMGGESDIPPPPPAAPLRRRPIMIASRSYVEDPTW
jgi:hypothetical protein